MSKTYTSVPSVSTGDVYQASTYNTYTAQNLNNLIVPPLCVLTIGSGTGTGGVSVTSSGVTFGNTTTSGTYTEEADTDDMHSTSSNQTRITITTAGVYVVTAGVAGNGSSEVSLTITKNGTDTVYQAVPATGTYFATATMTAMMNLAANDYLEFKCSSVTTRTYAVRFAAAWVGRTS